MSKPEYLNPLMENVLRLMEDAVLLRDHARYASAFALAVIALEEVGKLVQQLWKDEGIEPKTKRRTKHLSKQSVVFSMILAASMADEVVAMSEMENVSEQQLSALAQRATKNSATRQLERAERGLIDKAKQLGFYQDDLGEQIIAKREFTLRDINEIIEYSANAVRAVQSRKTLLLGPILFDAIHGKIQ